MNEWRPISTAPKDDVLLLYGTLYGSDDEWLLPKGLIRACGYWEKLDEAWALTDTTWAGPFIKPTHWQPLPPPPASNGGEE
jgi:hypothetical protein